MVFGSVWKDFFCKVLCGLVLGGSFECFLKVFIYCFFCI